MSLETRGVLPLDYCPVTYPGSPLRFRGPAADLDAPGIVCVGSTETYGRYIAMPYPDRLAHMSGQAVANMGLPNAGLDVMSTDPAICKALEGARAIVVQVPSASNLSNRLYAVHPRRNDRFVKASDMLQAIFHDVDFTEFHFTRHLLTSLQAISVERFEVLRQEVRTAWIARMRGFLDRARAPVHLLWLSVRAPEAHSAATGYASDPVLVTRSMIEEVADAAASISIVVDDAPRAPNGRLPQGMYCPSKETAVALRLPGPTAHEEAAAALLGKLA